VPHVRPWTTVESALRASDEGVPDRENAARHGVAIKTIRRWRREYQRRGRSRGQTHTSVPCPRCDGVALDEAAYAELFGWYLGDGHISTQRRGVFGLHIFNDVKYAQDNRHLCDLMRTVKPDSRPHTRIKNGCLVITTSWKHWPCLFPQHGPGRKHQRALGMTRWQWAVVEEFPADFLRGLFHSDGCLVRNWATRLVAGERKRYEYPRWQFVNESAEIMGWCGDALDLVGVAWKQTTRRTLSVSRRDDVARLTELIGVKA
jgi:hypothetical protein